MPTSTQKRVQIIPGQFSAMGEKVIEWVLDPASRPVTADDLRDQLEDIAVVTNKVNAVMFVETPDDVALFRLPPKYMVEASEARVTNPGFVMSDYNLPDYYGITDAADLPNNMTPQKLFHSRIGDYTTGECS